MSGVMRQTLVDFVSLPELDKQKQLEVAVAVSFNRFTEDGLAEGRLRTRPLLVYKRLGCA